MGQQYIRIFICGISEKCICHRTMISYWGVPVLNMPMSVYDFGEITPTCKRVALTHFRSLWCCVRAVKNDIKLASTA